MPSLVISVTPSERAAGRFINAVRRALLKALAEEEKKRGLKQTDIARAIKVHRSVINRELRGKKDISVGRIGQFAWALGRKPVFDLPEPTIQQGSNLPPPSQAAPLAQASRAKSNPPLDLLELLKPKPAPVPVP
jgi:transcriptional regulator with XRE-family HTH domain